MKQLSIYFSLLAICAAMVIPAAAQDDGSFDLRSYSHGHREIVITRSGSYRLRDDHKVRSGNGIVIKASNVTLDLGGNSITTNSPGTGSGIVIDGEHAVEVRNGKVGGFNVNVSVANSVNVRVKDLQIAGAGLAPNNGPSEIGVMLVQTRASNIENNVISSVNLGIFVRGGFSTGNRIFENVLTGGAVPSSNLLGICYNPAPNAGSDGPRGDNIYNNHITRFGFALAISTGSVNNVFNENVLASFNGGFREPEALTANGGTNVSEGNIMVTIPATMLP